MEVHPWHAFAVPEVATRLSTSAKTGLTLEEAADRLRTGANRLPQPKRDTLFLRLVRQLASPIAFVLVLAAAATFFLEHYTDSLVIVIALSVNVLMGIIQEGRASRAFEALQQGEARFAIVFRGGEPKRIPADELVPGDFITLLAGSAVPADIRLTEVHGLSVNEAALSGEWMPVEKTLELAGETAPLVERYNMVYSGTLVVSGGGKGIVVGTGAETELGRIAASMEKSGRRETPLMRDIREIARLLVAAALLVLLLIALLGYIRGLPFDEVLLIAIALAVASVPEGLPAAVTVVLALGMERILKAGGLVRNLLAAETLGTTSIVLTDKTGTLTQGRMELDSLVTYGGLAKEIAMPEPRMLLTAAVLASDAYVEERPDSDGEKLVTHGRAIEQAIVLAGLKIGIAQQACTDERPRIDELHFESSRRYGGMMVREEGKSVAYLTGAPELMLSLAHQIRDVEGRTHQFMGAVREQFMDALGVATRDGKRVVAVMRVPTDRTAFPRDNEREAFLKGGELVGLLIFSDAIRPEVKHAIREIQDAGARVIMLTGDNPETALSIALEVGIAKQGDIAYTGAELAALSDGELLEVLRHNRVFARVAPADKLRIAEVLKEAGEVTAMTGDGVNDAPALRAVAIGVAIGSGTDVAKEAADLVLLDNSFSVITAAIREGRRLRDNFKKIFAYMLSTNFSEVVLITFALVLGFPLPLLPTQILWSNLIEGGLMNFAFAFEPLYPSAMKRKPQDPEVAKVLSRELLWLIALVGFVTAGFLAIIYLSMVGQGVSAERIQTMMFIGISISSMFTAFSMKSFGTPIWKMPFLSNKFLLVSLAGSTLMLMIALYVPPVQALVHTVTPTVGELLLFVGVGLVNLATIEVAKWAIFIRPRALKVAAV